MDRNATGVLNIVDDDPVLAAEWMPGFAEMLNAPKPGTAPTAIARLFVGSWGVAFMTALRGAANTRAKLVLDWKPRYASWREGFSQELDDSARAKSSSP